MNTFGTVGAKIAYLQKWLVPKLHISDFIIDITGKSNGWIWTSVSLDSLLRPIASYPGTQTLELLCILPFIIGSCYMYWESTQYTWNGLADCWTHPQPPLNTLFSVGS